MGTLNGPCTVSVECTSGICVFQSEPVRRGFMSRVSGPKLSTYPRHYRRIFDLRGAIFVYYCRRYDVGEPPRTTTVQEARVLE